MEQNKKSCDVCGKEIPTDFVNKLCYECYDNQVKEIELREIQEKEEKQAPIMPQDESKIVDLSATTSSGTVPSNYNLNGITDPNYKENPEKEDKNQVLTNFAQFNKTGKFIWYPTRDMYEWIKDQGMERARQHPQFPKYVWKPKIVDVGCGSGLGSNILSQEADFVWGIDKNKLSVDFAKEVFTRVKNNYYYSSQVSFDQIDIVNETREFMKFDYVVAIEIIEHIYDYKKFLTQLITKFDKRDSRSITEYFISTPNRNSNSIEKTSPKNSYHVREWTSEEMHAALSEFFTKVELFNSKGEPVEIHTEHTPIIARCSGPRI